MIYGKVSYKRSKSVGKTVLEHREEELRSSATWSLGIRSWGCGCLWERRRHACGQRTWKLCVLRRLRPTLYKQKSLFLFISVV